MNKAETYFNENISKETFNLSVFDYLVQEQKEVDETKLISFPENKNNTICVEDIQKIVPKYGTIKLSMAEEYYNKHINVGDFNAAILDYLLQLDNTFRIENLVENTTKAQGLEKIYAKYGVSKRIYETYRRHDKENDWFIDDDMMFYRGIMINNMKNSEFTFMTFNVVKSKNRDKLYEVMKETGYLNYIKEHRPKGEVLKYLFGDISAFNLEILKEVL